MLLPLRSGISSLPSPAWYAPTVGMLLMKSIAVLNPVHGKASWDYARMNLKGEVENSTGLTLRSVSAPFHLLAASVLSPTSKDHFCFCMAGSGSPLMPATFSDTAGVLSMVQFAISSCLAD